MQPDPQQPSLGKPIARGNTADVYPWEPGYVLKLFHRFSAEDVAYELKVTRAVQASGVPAPAAGPAIVVDGRQGLVYERVDGSNMFVALQRKPWRLCRYARRLAELHAQVHQRSCSDEVPPQRRRLERKIAHAAALPEQVKAALLTQLATMPDGDRICHGDMHPGNVLMTAGGEVVIDWIDATRGNPLADVARTSILLLGAAATRQIPHPLVKRVVRLFHWLYLRRYFQLRPGGQEEYRRWLPIVAAARLSEGIPELEAWLASQAQVGKL